MNQNHNDILNQKIKEAVLYNYNSTEDYKEAKILLGNPNGVINFNGSKHKWAYQFLRNMQNRDWTPQQVNTSVDVNNYPKLTKEEKRLCDLVLAQLITNDSVQTVQLPRIISYVTSPVVAAALSRQTYEEALHSDSYSVIAEDVCRDTERIYNMVNPDGKSGEELEDSLALFAKNKSVADMYLRIYKDPEEITVKDIIMVMVANQILEELVFPGGFVSMYTLEDKLPGTVKMIQEINVGLLTA